MSDDLATCIVCDKPVEWGIQAWPSMAVWHTACHTRSRAFGHKIPKPEATTNECIRCSYGVCPVHRGSK